jgi:hypothetical protein
MLDGRDHYSAANAGNIGARRLAPIAVAGTGLPDHDRVRRGIRGSGAMEYRRGDD